MINREAYLMRIGTFIMAFVVVAGWLFSGWPQVWHTPSFPPQPSVAHAAVGNVGIWRDSAGAQIPGTSFTTFNFATEERNDGGYSFTGNNNLNLNEAGNYLVIATIDMDDNSNGRVNYEGRFTYTGSGDFVTLYGSGYARNSANDRAWVRAVGLVWGAAANDDIQFELRRDTDAPTGGSIANQSHVQVVRLHDSAAVGVYTDTADTSAYGTQTWTDAPFNTIVLENNTATIEKQPGNTDIRLKKANATFLVGYGLAFGTGGSRTQRVTKMVTGVSDIEHSFSYAYQRNSANEYVNPNGLFLYRNTNSETDLSVQAQRGMADVAGSAVRRVNTSGLFVIELPSSAEVFISHDSTGGQDIGGTNGDFNAMHTVDYNDATSFTKVNDTTVNAEKTMDALLLGQAYALRSGTSGSRMTAGARFEIQGIDQTRGTHGNYMRGNQGSQDTYHVGLSPSGIYGVSSGDDIQFEWFDDGDNGSTDTTVADAVGFSALNLDSLEEVTQGNERPIASAVSIDSDALSITLTENTTTNVECRGTVTDTDGYADIATVGAFLYRTSVGTSTVDDANNKYSLYGDASCVPSGGSGNSETYTCTFAVAYYADATDSGSPNASDDWTCELWPEDAVATGTPATDTIEVDSLTALDVTATIEYGSLDPNTESGSTNQTITLTNTGNRDMDPQLSGTDMSNGGSGTIPVENQEYAANAFTYGAGTDLTTSATTLDVTLPQRTDAEITDTVYWGIAVPNGTPEGNYTGTITVTAIPGV